MKGGLNGRRMGASEGSVLILVLWVLILVGFLAGQYLTHNRSKAALAFNSWESLKQKQAVDSALNLLATHPELTEDETWTFFSPGGVDLWVKVEDESTKMSINTASDREIRDKILKCLGEEGEDEEVDQLTDAILDWLDNDTEVRAYGAEVDFYSDQDYAYAPANGPFKILTELLLVRGVFSDLFWGDPMGSLMAEEEEAETIPPSLLETFTIHPDGVKRAYVLVPGKRKGYFFVVAFLKEEIGSLELMHLYQTMLVTAG